MKMNRAMTDIDVAVYGILLMESLFMIDAFVKYPYLYAQYIQMDFSDGE
jgi:hypothetical protein